MEFCRLILPPNGTRPTTHTKKPQFPKSKRNSKDLPTMMHHPQQDEQSKKALSKLQILAIFENNQAVELLRRGQCDAAITQLSASLKKQQKVMTASHSLLSAAATPADHEERITRNRSLLVLSLDQCMTSSRRTSTTRLPPSSSHPLFRAPTTAPAAEEASPFFYDTPIKIPSRPALSSSSSSSSSYNTSIIIATMVMFNLALAHHVAANELVVQEGRAGHTRSILLRKKAATLYELAFNLQAEAKISNNILFTLATVNNLGLAHMQNHNDIMSKMYFDHLLSTIMYVVVNCGSVDGREEQEQKARSQLPFSVFEVENFLLNIEEINGRRSFSSGASTDDNAGVVMLTNSGTRAAPAA